MLKQTLYQYVEKKTGFPPQQIQQVCTFLMLAGLCMAISVFGYTAASAHFLARAGADKIPFVYVVMGLISLPLYSGFSQLIDQGNRPRLFKTVLLSSAAAMTALAFLAGIGSPGIPYIIYIFYYMLWVMLVDILFPSTASDYYTLTELKKAAPLIAGAIALGGMAGGILAMLCSRIFTGPVMLAAPALLCLIAIKPVNRILNRAMPLSGTTDDEESAGVADTLRSLPLILKRFPLVLLLSLSACLFILLNCIAEFQVYTIYSGAFPKQSDLAAFLGIIMAVQCLLQFAIIYYLSAWLLNRLGIVRMNLVYPLTTLLSFLGLFLSFRPVSAVAAHINYDALYQSIDKQAISLNYNALPHRIMGRARVLGDGIFYFFGIALAGLFLILSTPLLSHAQIALCGIGLCLVFLGVRFLIGRYYLKTLMNSLSCGQIEFIDSVVDQSKAVMSYGSEVPTLLADPRPAIQHIGIELAAKTSDPTRYVDAVSQLLRSNTPEVRSAIIKHVRVFNPQIRATCIELLGNKNPDVRKDALIALLRLGEEMDEAIIGPLLNDPSATVRALAAVYAYQADLFEDEILKLLKLISIQDSDKNIRLEIIRATRDMGDIVLLPLILRVMEQTSDEILVEGLQAIAAITDPGDLLTTQTGLNYCDHSNPMVRVAALRLLSQTLSEELLPRIAAALQDPAQPVRTAASESLAAFGHAGVSAAVGLPRNSAPETAAAVLETIIRSRISGASDVMFNFIEPNCRLAADLLSRRPALNRLPDRNNPAGLMIELFAARILDQIMQILKALGDHHAGRAVHVALTGTDLRLRSGALELLDTLRAHRFIKPALPILHQLTGQAAWAQNEDSDPETVLKAMLEAPDKWLRIAALMGFAGMDSGIAAQFTNDDDEHVCTCAARIETQEPFDDREDFFMNHLLFLKDIPLFKNLSFDDLLSLDAVLRKRSFLQHEIIKKPGTSLQEMYLIYRGTVQMPMADTDTPIAFKEGDCFGEVALFEDVPLENGLTAASDCVILELSREQFHTLAMKSPEVMFELCKILASQARDTALQKGGGSSN